MIWAAEEFKDIDLGDGRLNKRTVLLAESMAAKPLASIPQACGSWAQTQAAYRYLAQDGIKWSDILAPHWQSAEIRMRAHRVVLCIQDTTELDFNGQGIAGLGPLSYEAQRGMYVHPTYAVTPEREPLGVLDARAQFTTSSLADLYDPLTMPPALRKAHQKLDAAVDAAYQPSGGKKSYTNDAERVAFLFDLYQRISSLLPAAKPGKAKRQTKGSS